MALPWPPCVAMAINVGPAAVITVIHCPPDTAHTFLHPAALTLTCLCLDPLTGQLAPHLHQGLWPGV